MGEGRLCDMINKAENRTVVTVDSICIQAYLVFKAGGGKKKRRKRKIPTFPTRLSKYNFRIRHNTPSHVNEQKVLSVEESQTH